MSWVAKSCVPTVRASRAKRTILTVNQADGRVSASRVLVGESYRYQKLHRECPQICVSPRKLKVSGLPRTGRFLLRRQTERKRMTTKLHELGREMQRRRHQPIPEQGDGSTPSYADTPRTMAFLPTGTRLAAFRTQVARQWHRASLRRSQRRRLLWARMRRLVSRWLPRTPISHPWPASGPARQSLSEAGSTDRLGSTDAPIPRSRTRDRERHCRWTA